MIDLVLLVAIFVFAVTGWRKGFLYGLLTLVGFLCGAAFGLWLAPKLIGSWDDGLPKVLTALLIVFFLAVLGHVLVGLVGKRLNGSVTWQPAVVLNSVAGSALSVLAMLVVAWFAADLFVHANSSSLAKDVRKSEVLGVVDNIVPVGAHVLTGELQAMFDNTGFPDVFTGLGPEPVEPIGSPDAAIVEREAVVEAGNQTVKVIGRARACDSNLEGSGFAFAPERVMTNAHVVAGVNNPAVLVGGVGDSYPAEVVYFDPDTDIAVLAVPDLPAEPLQFSLDANRGDNLAVIGYPENGPLATVPARVREIQTASGRDIYGRGVVVREIISMRADVRPGNSGGPVVDRDGDVVGLVFANSLDREDTGYAMTARQVAPAITEGVSSSDEVSTGACT